MTLKPCPFCGGIAQIVRTGFPAGFNRGEIMVRCATCKARSATVCVAFDLRTKHEISEQTAIVCAVTAWNRRATA